MEDLTLRLVHGLVAGLGTLAWFNISYKRDDVPSSS